MKIVEVFYSVAIGVLIVILTLLTLIAWDILLSKDQELETLEIIAAQQEEYFSHMMKEIN
jgi:hypothetical protein